MLLVYGCRTSRGCLVIKAPVGSHTVWSPRLTRIYSVSRGNTATMLSLEFARFLPRETALKMARANFWYTALSIKAL